LEKTGLNKNLKFLRVVIVPVFLAFLFYSCNPTKYVPRDETLLDENVIHVNKEGIKKADLEPYLKQKPNKKIFGSRFHLGLYNLSNINKQNWFQKWLRNIGEEPVIFDPYAVKQSVGQIKDYISSKGYFDSSVGDSTKTEKQKTTVYYNVGLATPYRIRNIYFNIEDSTIATLFYFDSINCLIERGKPYDVDVFQSERTRFERFVKDMGFYNFSSDHIYFQIDSTVGNHQVNVYYGIRKFTTLDPNNNTVVISHPVYRVRDVYIYPDYVPREVLEKGEEYLKSLDTISYRGYYFISSSKKPEIKYDVIIQSLYLKPGSTYNLTNTERSQKHLLSLKTYRLVNVVYNELHSPADSTARELMLDCNIQLTLLSQQSFRIELEGTNSAGYLGGALNLVYQHKNIFHGAELLNLRLRGAYEAIKRETSGISSSREFGVETSLRFPKFVLPLLKTEEFIKKYNPTTTSLLAYNYQDLPTFTRTMGNATFGYNWKSGIYHEHIVNPLQLNVINLVSIDSAFSRMIQNSSQVAAFHDVLILGGSYSYIFSNQQIKRSRDFWFMRFNFETAGNLLSASANAAKLNKENGSYQVFGQPFAQYVRADVDIRYNVILNDVSSIVYRGFAGAAIPYGNSKAIPFEKQYFGGGANSIRAWQVRSLGPGSYAIPNPDSVSFFNQTADIKLELNAEYRFKLFWILEGALFMDAGNIWSYNYDAIRPGSQFRINRFYKDMALGTGLGLRFDFKFVIGRVDFGMKLRDPAIPDGRKWITQRPYTLKNDFAMVVAIGYPF
jgi:outer membrane protein assembly factor BamA